MSEMTAPQAFDNDSPKPRLGAMNLDAYRQQIIQDRWLSTLILSIHLELHQSARDYQMDEAPLSQPR
jgi:hypothetical protein